MNISTDAFPRRKNQMIPKNYLYSEFYCISRGGIAVRLEIGEKATELFWKECRFWRFEADQVYELKMIQERISMATRGIVS